jgi:hypothetical protein
MKSSRIPIVIGVTGHRDLRAGDVPRLEEITREILSDLKQRHPHTPIVVQSSLAEGADLLAARIAVEMGLELIAPLPMAAAEYEKDFSTAATREEFSRLLAKARAAPVLPFAAGVTAENIGEPDHRAQQYLKSGLHIVRHCHILLAFWDGNKAQKTGGTSQMVNFKLTGFPTAELPEWTVLNPPDAGTVFHVVTPRISHPNPEGAFSLRKHFVNPRFAEEKEADGKTSREKAENVFTALLEHTDIFNGDVLCHQDALSIPAEKSCDALLSSAAPADPDLAELAGRYATADALANHFQKWRHLFLGSLCVLVVPATVCLASYHAVERTQPALMLLYIGGFWFFALIAGLVYLAAQFGNAEKKHLDYRALAEGLKVLFYWRVAGIRDDVGAQYLRKQQSELDWIRLAVRASDLLTSFPAAEAAPYDWIKTQWMDHQQRYFEKGAATNQRRASIFEWISRLVLLAGLLLAADIAVESIASCLHKDPAPESLIRRLHIFSVIIVGMLATAGSTAAYAEKLAFVQLSKQYGQMRRLFRTASNESASCIARGESEHVRAIIRRLGLEALRENGDWVMLHRERPMEVRLG